MFYVKCLAHILYVFEGNDKETLEGSEIIHLLGVGSTLLTETM